MKFYTVTRVLLALIILGAMVQSSMAVDDIPDRKMVSKGGVLYPYTGDSSQERFQTPKNASQLIPPGTLIGVLPDDCVSASSGSIGTFYRCDNDFALKEELFNGRTVYRVIENP